MVYNGIIEVNQVQCVFNQNNGQWLEVDECIVYGRKGNEANKGRRKNRRNKGRKWKYRGLCLKREDQVW